MPKYLETEIATFEAMSDWLFEHHAGECVVIVGDKLHGVYDTFDTAAREAIRVYGDGPYLIRRVKPDILPLAEASAFGPVRAAR